ncbi:Cytidine deaminase protein [Dioscorea alata]|uniref:Cytidine deaminase protein n=1 Tax=Dioscorea alata TaxID=55571 RepID=A0ACB7TTH5_DIOAL|nr:Cytidine deaminase protein [Dioscorea alata]
MDAPPPTKSTAENASPARFVIDVEEAENMMKAQGLSSVMDLLPVLVPAAKKLARAPISGHLVGAVGLGESGRIYFGANLEFPGLPLHHSLTENGPFRCIAVSSAPCGHCRQFFQEIRNASQIQILITGSGSDLAFRPLSYYIPEPFGPSDLLHDDSPFLLEPHNNRIEIIDDGHEAPNRILGAAVNGARSAHAPYSGCAAGFAVGDGKGRVGGGGYMESAAYNPGMGPVAAALVTYLMAGGGAWEDIVEAALVEKEKAVVPQEATARVVLAAVAPKARLQVSHYREA